VTWRAILLDYLQFREQVFKSVLASGESGRIDIAIVGQS
jgi:hypothetical protein